MAAICKSRNCSDSAWFGKSCRTVPSRGSAGLELRLPLLLEGGDRLGVVAGAVEKLERVGLVADLRVEGGGETLVERPPRERDREGRALSDLARERGGGIEQLGARDDVVHEPDALELASRILLAGEHELAGPADPDKTREEKGGAQLGHHAHAREEKSELGICRRNPDVAQQCHRAADAQRIAVDGRDGRLREMLHERRELLDPAGPIAALGAGPAAAADLRGEE